MIRILRYGEVENDKIFARVEPSVNVEAVVSEIIENVKNKGDEALFAYCEKFDKAKLTALQVTAEEIREAGRKYFSRNQAAEVRLLPQDKAGKKTALDVKSVKKVLHRSASS